MNRVLAIPAKNISAAVVNNMIAFEKSVGAVVFRNDGGKIKYLLLHYRPSGRTSDKNSGHWDFPKGHIEKGETEDETLRREMKEETGIADLKIIPNFKIAIRYFYRAKGNEREERKKSGKAINVWKKVIFYAAETKTEEIKISHEHIGFEWLDFDAALEKVTYKNAKNILKKADEFLNIAKPKSLR